MHHTITALSPEINGQDLTFQPATHEEVPEVMVSNMTMAHCLSQSDIANLGGQIFF